MKPILRALTLLFVARALCGAQERGLPTKIVLTEADQRDINDRHMLRGRPVTGKVDPRFKELTWDGLRVFTGKKRDVIGWFRTFSMSEAQRVMGFNQHSGMSSKGNYQYDLLCSALLQSGDADVRRVVLWNYQGLNTGYLTDDWKALAKDQSLGSADRLLAGIRIWWMTRHSWPQVFWAEFADRVQPEDMVAIEMEMKVWNDGGCFTWGVFDSRYADRAKAQELLLALIRRGYLGAKRGEGRRAVVEYALVCLSAYRNEGRGELSRTILNRLIEIGGDTRSVKAWECASFAHLDDESAQKLRRMAARVPSWRLAGRMFWRYLGTPAGRREIERDGGKRFLEEYLTAAFGKKTGSERQQFLCGLVDWNLGADFLISLLDEKRVDVTVTGGQYNQLQRAWKDVPKALDFLLIHDEE